MSERRVCTCRGDQDPICEPELFAAYNAGEVVRMPRDGSVADLVRARYAAQTMQLAPEPTLRQTESAGAILDRLRRRETSLAVGGRR